MKLIKLLDIRFKSGKNRRYGLFYCEACGEFVEKVKECGLNQNTCGCARHGMEGTRLNIIWKSMIARCVNNGSTSYNRYGAKGIKVCDEWRKFIPFKNWALNNGYSDCLQIDRIDNNGDYTPNNCRFVTPAENSQNRRSTKLNPNAVKRIKYLHDCCGISKLDLSFEYRVHRKTISNVVNRKTWKNI